MRVNPRKKTRLGRFKFVSVLFSTTLSLFIVGLFGVIVIQAKTLTSIIRENIEIQVFLNKNLDETGIAKIGKTLESKAYVLQKEGSAALTFISKEDAAASFLEDTGEDFSKFLDDNPLRDSYTLAISEEFQTAEQIEEIVEEIQLLDGVFEVTYMADLVESINQNLTKVALVMGGFILILGFTVVMLINNTIKLALFSQRFLIRSMQLVGATRGFIRKPFLSRALGFGILAGLIASALLFGIIEYTKANIDGFAMLQDYDLLYYLFGALVLIGATLSVFSTLQAVNKYLNMSLDELY
ncbi:Cell division protein FtsX [Indibacter alkaliphilus LW1]|jgi:cell division transport system permease protein|uniref:Cell division protein FtsX n=1 Tax=Indibacter alkaliphilus (strain CCUG 57479 / KCTC 22604 / LW1) TaxID=1189612 RepID=S2D9P4_INDAL|nr:permease-like cell division protein FtsX [Indibacter alkaliphilus]EOZ95579.1 Cell division protein FtsX [Indibacter alkaliphilus LW1]